MNNEPVIVTLHNGSSDLLLSGHEYEFTWRIDGAQRYDRKSRGVFLGPGGPSGDNLQFSFRGPEIGRAHV